MVQVQVNQRLKKLGEKDKDISEEDWVVLTRVLDKMKGWFDVNSEEKTAKRKSDCNF